jgi:hypothetical protein
LIKDPSTPIFPNILHNINHLLKPAVLVLVSLTSLLCHVPPPRLQTAEGKVVCWLPLHAAPCSELIPDDARVGTLSCHMEGRFRMHMAQLTDGPPFLSGVENSRKQERSKNTGRCTIANWEGTPRDESRTEKQPQPSCAGETLTEKKTRGKFLQQLYSRRR